MKPASKKSSLESLVDELTGRPLLKIVYEPTGPETGNPVSKKEESHERKLVKGKDGKWIWSNH
jgi:hypothetical protein